ncbi:baseplate J/gp47 family protein [Paenibacillus radicis (ex Xue et al. 2023)]|uniref:Baseplate J/gp47 family protein n=1 Tax=Paenibacillus radicis (ex Xue et al. 2023) TaxID=2972489 RepID=A0ABT1YSM9_9BACL|nr:baseplate J/gp47 family protein [Paenibacillus radicis (ex Xue et al. 2023)]MCR8636191.1 baseplate J/gp47 family protein [Paenibacillus radicis (ex Xue et al. 2023)]
MLDEKGFKRKRYADLIMEMEAKAREAYGETINTSERSPLGIILRIFAWFLSKPWEKAEDVYYSAYINTAQGVQQDRLGPYVGISRIPEQFSSGSIAITGTPDYTVAAGFSVRSRNAVYFTTTVPVTLDASGHATVSIRASLAGVRGNVAGGLITEIVNPNPNVASVTNPAPTVGGREKETDPEFRERFQLSVSGGGAATLDSIRSALLGIAGVRAATVIENTSLATDAEGRPGKSFQAYLLGGGADAIAQCILETKAVGIQSFGDVSRTVYDLSGSPHIIKFSYAEKIALKVQVAVTKNEQYPVDGDAQIRTAIIRYIGGEDVDGSLYSGLGMGDDVIYTKLISSIYKVVGIEDVNVQVATSGSFGTGNIAVSSNKVAQILHSDIEVSSHA